MFDTHCHLNSIEFPDDLTGIITSARQSGVNYFLIPGFDLESSRKAIEISTVFENIYSAVGIHPTKNLGGLDINQIIFDISKLIEKHNKIKAIGEIGLDYYHFVSPSRVQKLFLVELLKMSVKSGLAIIIHNRQAGEDLLPLLANMGSGNFSGKLVFHCCEANWDILKFAEKNKCYIGVDGDITYEPLKQNFIRKVPLELLLVETDSPFLTPEPIRSAKIKPKYNEPKNLVLIAEKVAEIKNVSIEKIKQETTNNARNLFGI